MAVSMCYYTMSWNRIRNKFLPMKGHWRFNNWLTMLKRRHFPWGWAANKIGVSQNVWFRRISKVKQHFFLEEHVTSFLAIPYEPQGSFWFWDILPWRKGCDIKMAHLLFTRLLNSSPNTTWSLQDVQVFVLRGNINVPCEKVLHRCQPWRPNPFITL